MTYTYVSIQHYNLTAYPTGKLNQLKWEKYWTFHIGERVVKLG